MHISFPKDYPFIAPTFKFETKIYHPNVSSDGSISGLDLIDNWNAGLYVKDILDEITQLLESPKPDVALEPEIAKIFNEDKAKFDDLAKQCTLDYAT